MGTVFQKHKKTVYPPEKSGNKGGSVNMALLEVKNIYKSFGGVKAIVDFSLEANAGEIHGIIGPNGAGKTTIFPIQKHFSLVRRIYKVGHHIVRE